MDNFTTRGNWFTINEYSIKNVNVSVKDCSDLKSPRKDILNCPDSHRPLATLRQPQ